MVVSAWSESLLSGFSILLSLHVCFRHPQPMPRFPQCLQLSSTSTAKISKTCCLLLPVASDVNLAATSKVLLPGCSSDMALFAVLHTVSHSVSETPDPRVATCCSFFNSDCTVDSAEETMVDYSFLVVLVCGKLPSVCASRAQTPRIILSRCRCSRRSVTLTTGCVVVFRRSFRKQHMLFAFEIIAKVSHVHQHMV